MKYITKYITKTGSPPGILALMLGAMLLGLFSHSAQAAGTASSTVITNLANIQYTAGATTLTVCSAPGAGNSTLDDDGTCVAGAFGAVNTDFAVDNKVDVLVTEGNATFTQVTAGQLAAVTTFTVLNEGNTNQDFALTIGNGPAVALFGHTDNRDFTLPADCTVSNIVISVGSMGAYTAGDQHINALTPDSEATVSVACNIPATWVNDDAAIVYLLATARADDAANTLGGVLAETANTEDGVEIVFGDSAGTDDALGDAAHSDRDIYWVQTASLTVSKTVATLCDPVDGDAAPHNIPGAVVRWTITIANTGGASANLTTFSDAIPTNTSFDPDLITGIGSTALNGQCEYAAAGLGLAESANGNGVRIQVTGAGRFMAGTAGGGTANSSYYTGGANGDGVDVGASVVVDFTTAFPVDGTNGYAAGELKSGETATVYFNVGIN